VRGGETVGERAVMGWVDVRRGFKVFGGDGHNEGARRGFKGKKRWV
jgi:hypothetical protein